MCRSAAKREQSGDTEWASHRAAAHMGRGEEEEVEEEGGVEGYRMVQLSLELGRDLALCSPCLSLLPPSTPSPKKRKKNLKKSQISCLFQAYLAFFCLRSPQITSFVLFYLFNTLPHT